MIFLFAIFITAWTVNAFRTPLVKIARDEFELMEICQQLNKSKCSVVVTEFPEHAGHQEKFIRPPVNPFDKSVEITPQLNALEAIDDLIPNEIEERNYLLDDIEKLIQLMRCVQSKDDSLICRLNSFKGIKCPKWHEDNVKFRLLKTYVGPGTDWVDPSNNFIRAKNAILDVLDKDKIIPNEKAIHSSRAGDVIILRGKQATNFLGPPPVLHRSPIPKSDEEYRLLLAISVAQRHYCDSVK